MIENPPPFEAVRELCRVGRVLEAWETAGTCPLPLAEWPYGEALDVAAGLAGALGAQRLRSALEWRNWRHDRRHPQRFFQVLFSRLRCVPPVKLIREIEGFLPGVPVAQRGVRADLLAMLAWLHGRHRDFTPAFDCIAQALELHPESAWIHVEHSMGRELADPYDGPLPARHTWAGGGWRCISEPRVSGLPNNRGLPSCCRGFTASARTTAPRWRAWTASRSARR